MYVINNNSLDIKVLKGRAKLKKLSNGQKRYLHSFLFY